MSLERITELRPFSRENLAVGAADWADIGEAIISKFGGLSNVAFEIQNLATTPATALGGIQLLARAHEDGSWFTMVGTSGWSVAGPVYGVFGTPSSLAAGASAQAIVAIGPVNAIKIQAKSGGATVLANGTFTGNATGWTLGAGWEYADNAVSATDADATLSQALADLDTEWTDGQIYEVTFTVSSYVGGSLQVGTNTDPSQAATAIAANGTYSIQVTADDHADGLVFTPDGFTGIIDSVSAIVTVPVRALVSASAV